MWQRDDNIVKDLAEANHEDFPLGGIPGRTPDDPPSDPRAPRECPQSAPIAPPSALLGRLLGGGSSGPRTAHDPVCALTYVRTAIVVIAALR